jgi:heterodisulfide reductase subunit B
MHVLELLALALGIPMAELSLEFHRSPVPQFVQKLEDHDG